MVEDPRMNPPLRRADDIIQRVIEEADERARDHVNGLDRILSERIQALADRYASVLEVREHQHAEMDLRYQQRFEAQEDAARLAFEGRERAVLEQGMRHQQQIDAQEKAVGLALDGLNRQFHEHIRSVRDETTASLSAADKAIIKSELAVEKRFEAVDLALSKTETAIERRFETVDLLRSQVAEQARTFLPRSEGEQRIAALAEKVDDLNSQLSGAMSRVNSRLDLAAGRSTGIGAGWGYLVGAVGLVAAVLAIVATLAG